MRRHTPHIHGEPRKDDADAFIPDPDGGPIADDHSVEAELLEDFLRSATTGQNVGEELRDQIVSEEYGGPFVTTTTSEEIIDDVDESNPCDAKREALPSAMRGDRI